MIKVEGISLVGNIKSLTSTLIQRLSLSSRLGISFDGKRDLFKIFGYRRTLKFQDFLEKFQRQDIAKRIVSSPVSATWRNPPVIRSSNDKPPLSSAILPSSFDDRLLQIVTRHSLWKKIERADKLSGIGNYSILLLGFSGSEKMDKAVVKKDSNELLFLQPYSQPNAEIIELDNDITSVRFGQPLFYEITTNDPLSDNHAILPHTISQQHKKIKVHHSRIVHIAENTLESDIFGTPRLEAVYNLLDDLLKVVGGTSETFWLTANRGMQANIDKDTELTEADAEALSTELDEYQHQLRRVIQTQGVDIKSLGSDVPSPKDTVNVIVSLISGATGIPRRILTGSEAGQLASEQDRANWSDRINERRFNFAEPCILRPLIARLSNAGVLPDVKPEDISFNWPTNFQLTPLEQNQSIAQKARATINLTKSLDGANPLLTESEAREIIGLPPIKQQ